MTPPMTDDLVRRLRALLEAATPGPWESEMGTSVHSRAEGLKLNRVHGYGYGDDGFICDLNDGEYHEYTDGAEQSANASLIAEGITALPTLLARIEALEAENRALKESVVAFGAPWAVHWAKQFGLPDGHLCAMHYDILAEAGARMDAFTRHEDSPHAD